jgi:hypothetical protein
MSWFDLIFRSRLIQEIQGALSSAKIVKKQVKFMQDKQHLIKLKIRALRANSAVHGKEALPGLNRAESA